MLSAYGMIVRPKGLSELQDIFDQVCASQARMSEPFVRDHIACRLMSLFQAGERDAEALFRHVMDDPAFADHAFVEAA